MKKIVYYVIIVVLLLFSVYLAFKLWNEKHKPIPIDQVKTDTIYVNKPFKPIPEYKFINIPYLVTFWSDPDIKIDTVYVDSSQIHYVLPSGNVDLNHQFLVKYPENPKLLQMVTSKESLEFTFLKPDGLVRTEKYSFYPEVNYYNYQNDGLTYKRKPFIQRFEISPEVMVRPFANMYDLNFGLKYKTRKIYYEIGINSYYYPVLSFSQLNVTPYVRVGLTL